MVAKAITCSKMKSVCHVCRLEAFPEIGPRTCVLKLKLFCFTDVCECTTIEALIVAKVTNTGCVS